MMGYNRPDPFSQPGKFDLEIIGEIDDPEACYSFDMLVVWQHKDGRLFYSTDAGCSCPSPFEDTTSLDELIPISPETWSAFEDDVKGHCKLVKDGQWAVEKVELLRKVRHALLEGAR